MPPRISALLLAAGSSTRMGQPKALLPIRSQPAIRHCLTTLRRSPVREIIVVLGPESEAAAPLLADLSVTLVRTTGPRCEMAASVRLGVQAMRPDAVGALISLVDHPLVQAQTLKEVLAAAASGERIVIPTFRGRRGHPTFFPQAVLTDIFRGCNLREIIGRHPGSITLVPVADEGVVLDMDTPEDYREICRRLEEGRHE
jgi:molybdenum cofactor cytidylyltransferase